MIETYVRGLEAGRQSALAVAGGRPDLPMGGGGGYGSTPSCYRCNGNGHFARECPEFTGTRPAAPRVIDTGPRNIPCKDGPNCKFLNLPCGCRYLHDGAPATGGVVQTPVPTIPCRDGKECKFVNMPGGCRFKHDGVVAGVAQEGYPTSNCYRCSGVGHFARDCPTFTGVRRDAMPSGGGPIRRAGFPGRDHQGPAECYRCNKMGHFARECPEYTGVPMSGVYRGQPPLPTSAPPYGRGTSRPPAPPGDYGTSKCLKCNKYGHFARECTQEENSCYKCSESGHLAKECEKPDICYVCNKEGHMAKDCPDGDQKTCYKCGGKGHIALECPSQEAIPRAKRSPNVKKDEADPVDEAAGDQVLSASDLEDL